MTSGLLQPPDGWLWRRLTGLCPGKSRENIDCKVNNVLSICLDLPWPMFSFLHHSFNNIPMFPFKALFSLQLKWKVALMDDVGLEMSFQERFTKVWN